MFPFKEPDSYHRKDCISFRAISDSADQFSAAPGSPHHIRAIFRSFQTFSTISRNFQQFSADISSCYGSRTVMRNLRHPGVRNTAPPPSTGGEARASWLQASHGECRDLKFPRYNRWITRCQAEVAQSRL